MTDYLSKYNDYESSLQLDDSAKLLISNIASQCADNFELRKEPASIGKEDEVIQIVETQQEFIQIYSKMEQEMENNLNLQYSRHCDLIALQIERIGTISSKIQKANEILDSLQSKYEFVQSKTMGLQTACENLVDEQAHMVTVTQEIDDKLKYFKEFDQVSKMLNAPGEALVLDPKFIPMLQKLDQCLSFVAGHSHYKESDLYAMRYRQAMTRSLTLVKLYFVDSIRTLQNDVTVKVNSKSSELLSENLQVSLFYVRFKALAATTQPLLFELEQRCLPNVEYFALLNDCIYSYITCRKTLLTRYAVEKFRERKPNDTLVQFAAASATYAIQLANDEVSLFKSFFTQGYEHLNNYIAEYSALFSSSLKSLIIHQGNVEILVELCSSFIFMQKNESNGAERILDAVLEDTQIRLQQIAGEFISTDIKRFKPREQEFLLLARMQGMPEPANVTSTVSVDGVLQPVIDDIGVQSSKRLINMEAFASAPIEPSDAPIFGGGEFYVTVMRTTSLLSKLYGILPDPIFDELAQDAIESCRISVHHAVDILSRQHSEIDGNLFAIKNLMQLRDHATFYKTQNSRHAKSFSLLDIFGVLKNAILDSNPEQEQVAVRELLDQDLKRFCEAYIQLVVNSCISKLLKLKDSLQNVRVGTPIFISPEEFSNTFETEVDSFKLNLETPIVKLKQYLGDKQAQMTLLRIIRGTILNHIKSYLDLIVQYGAKDGGTEIQAASKLDEALRALI